MRTMAELLVVGCFCVACAAFIGARPSRAAGQCATHADCVDDDACTSDACVQGSCVHRPLDCDDHDPCTEDACNASGECHHAAPHGTAGEQCVALIAAEAAETDTMATPQQGAMFSRASIQWCRRDAVGG